MLVLYKRLKKYNYSQILVGFKFRNISHRHYKNTSTNSGPENRHSACPAQVSRNG